MKSTKKSSSSGRFRKFLFGRNRSAPSQGYLDEFVKYLNLDTRIVRLHEFCLKIQDSQHHGIFDLCFVDAGADHEFAP